MGFLSSGPDYTGSFRSTSFQELFDNQNAIEADVLEDISITKIPGGNVSVIQSSGQVSRTLDLAVAAEPADMASLQTKVGTSGSLVYRKGTQTARLVGVTNTRYNAIWQCYTATLKLILA